MAPDSFVASSLRRFVAIPTHSLTDRRFAHSIRIMSACAALMPGGLEAQAGDRMTGAAFATRSEVIARHAAAATSQPLVTQIAIDILKQGGSAVDAAIAANAALGLMEPTGSGIGGDLFAIVWDAGTKKLYGLNGSGRSPYDLSLEHLRRQGLTSIPPYGPLPVTVPGCVDGWFELHHRFGRLPMSAVLAPAIAYAREGFPVSELIAHYWSRGGTKLKDQPNFAATFLPAGRAPGKGDVFKNPDLARTYEALARDGRDAFYRGELTNVMVGFCERVGCFLRARDFAEHTSTWVDPVSTSYRGYEVWELPPNGQGIAVLQMLNILEAFDLRAMGHHSADYLHHLIEAKKIAFEDRARFYADPAFAPVPTAELISKPYAAGRRALLDPRQASQKLDPGDPRLAQGDTIYLTVADGERNMVSLVQSNYRGFGSGLVPDGLGFVLHDRGELFSLAEGHPNVYAPHKRPFHTIIPGFVTREGRPWLSFGVMGGDMQPQGHVQVLSNLIDFGMNVQEAADAARFHHQGSSEPTGERMSDGGWVALESGIAVEVRRELAQRGHRITFESDGFGGCQAILYDVRRDLYIAASESRKDGQAAGY
ncbi:MAG: gamma-glutamyltransferase [Planctomycetes bacterium]|nr:gamma-glutamyltransferase [Planctomycetota bacterium]